MGHLSFRLLPGRTPKASRTNRHDPPFIKLVQNYTFSVKTTKNGVQISKERKNLVGQRLNDLKSPCAEGTFAHGPEAKKFGLDVTRRQPAPSSSLPNH